MELNFFIPDETSFPSRFSFDPSTFSCGDSLKKEKKNKTKKNRKKRKKEEKKKETK